ncbi:hypothetical protein L917_09509 [Phytophthora nicotianae]|uniref:Uncharacterized protein n=2 Tax=Phytophthora nicotianae TaxID=4792 RepID=W2R8P5_PHYN3|nr:hypothetical protein PPTG_01390 [Phytophthora nicotianae INRA-310]ETL92090.1 hypothetical protein L917_09509 [Phytophthora nicotianae]ETN21084.1 hypothetical protein PPTG_01390 [Phytophthora nicotianae INRA-310]
MLIDSQDDVVDESCSSQFDSGSLPPMMASMRAELPRPEVLDKSKSSSTIDFRGSSASTSGACSWRSHIQRDESEPPKRAGSEWNCRNSKTRQSASAMVLARKRKRDEQRKLLNSKKQCTDSDCSEYTAGDSEQDSLDMEEQLTAFVEYNSTDMDSLDINPSQDFDGDEEQDIATQASQYMQTCSWQDVTDVNQFQEEASEVFDNIIYASRAASISDGSSKSTTHCRPQEQGIACSSFLPIAIPEQRAVVEPPSDDSEGSLSDGFDVAVNLVSKTKTTSRPSNVETSNGVSPKAAAKPQWKQRRSVKRDCSFIDNSSSYSVNGRLLLMASPTPATTSEASQTSSDSVIELRDGCFDSSDDIQAVPARSNDVSTSVPTSMPASVDTMTVMSSSLPSGASYSGAIQPRLVRKRRKVGQLTLDGFLRSKMP